MKELYNFKYSLQHSQFKLLIFFFLNRFMMSREVSCILKLLKVEEFPPSVAATLNDPAEELLLLIIPQKKSTVPNSNDPHPPSSASSFTNYPASTSSNILASSDNFQPRSTSSPIRDSPESPDTSLASFPSANFYPSSSPGPSYSPLSSLSINCKYWNVFQSKPQYITFTHCCIILFLSVNAGIITSLVWVVEKEIWRTTSTHIIWSTLFPRRTRNIYPTARKRIGSKICSSRTERGQLKFSVWNSQKTRGR